MHLMALVNTKTLFMVFIKKEAFSGTKEPVETLYTYSLRITGYIMVATEELSM